MSATRVAGLFGKLPAHGDFVRRGWDDATVDAIDAWLTAGVAALHDGLDDDAFAARMHAAPLWQGYVPPGMLGPHALHLGLAPSIDRAGRLFPIAVGIAGAADAVWAGADGVGATLDAAIYDALAGRVDADALLDVLDRTDGAEPRPAPATAAWWRDADSPTLEVERIDAALLERLFGERPH